MTRRRLRGFQTKVYVARRSLVLDLGHSRRILSSAVKCGGCVRARYILNHQVPEHPIGKPSSRQQWQEPSRYLGGVAGELGLTPACVGLMTAVALRKLVAVREQGSGVWVEGFVTVGVSNAVKAGDPVIVGTPRGAPPLVGTINIMVITNARLTTSAMVSAIQVATESKTAVLLDRRVPTWAGAPGATGTGTDVTVIACGAGPLLRYSGTHTEIGAMIGRLVRRAVSRGLLRARASGRRRVP